MAGWVLLAVGMVLFAAVAGDEGALAVCGTRSSGEITRVWGSGKHTRAEVRFRPSAHPTEVRFWRTVTFREHLRAGQRVNVRYWRTRPTFAVINSAGQLWLPTVVMTVLAGLCLWGGLTIVRKQRA